MIKRILVAMLLAVGLLSLLTAMASAALPDQRSDLVIESISFNSESSYPGQKRVATVTATKSITVTDISFNPKSPYPGQKTVVTVEYTNTEIVTKGITVTYEIKFEPEIEDKEVITGTFPIEEEIPAGKGGEEEFFFRAPIKEDTYNVIVTLNGKKDKFEQLLVVETALPDGLAQLFAGLGLFVAVMAIMAVATEVVIELLKSVIGLKHKVTAMEALDELKLELPGALAGLGVDADWQKKIKDIIDVTKDTLKPVQAFTNAYRDIKTGSLVEGYNKLESLVKACELESLRQEAKSALNKPNLKKHITAIEKLIDNLTPASADEFLKKVFVELEKDPQLGLKGKDYSNPQNWNTLGDTYQILHKFSQDMKKEQTRLKDLKDKAKKAIKRDLSALKLNTIYSSIEPIIDKFTPERLLEDVFKKLQSQSQLGFNNKDYKKREEWGQFANTYDALVRLQNSGAAWQDLDKLKQGAKDAIYKGLSKLQKVLYLQPKVTEQVYQQVASEIDQVTPQTAQEFLKKVFKALQSMFTDPQNAEKWIHSQVDTYLTEGRKGAMSLVEQSKSELVALGLEESTVNNWVTKKLVPALDAVEATANQKTTTYTFAVKRLLDAVEERRNQMQSPARKFYRRMRDSHAELSIAMGLMVGIFAWIVWITSTVLPDRWEPEVILVKSVIALVPGLVTWLAFMLLGVRTKNKEFSREQIVFWLIVVAVPVTVGIANEWSYYEKSIWGLVGLISPLLSWPLSVLERWGRERRIIVKSVQQKSNFEIYEAAWAMSATVGVITAIVCIASQSWWNMLSEGVWWLVLLKALSLPLLFGLLTRLVILFFVEWWAIWELQKLDQKPKAKLDKKVSAESTQEIPLRGSLGYTLRYWLERLFNWVRGHDATRAAATQYGNVDGEVKETIENVRPTTVANVLLEREDKHRDEEASRIRVLRIITIVIGTGLAYYLNADAAEYLNYAVPGIGNQINAVNLHEIWSVFPEKLTVGIILTGFAASAGSKFWRDLLGRLQVARGQAEEVARFTRKVKGIVALEKRNQRD